MARGAKSLQTLLKQLNAAFPNRSRVSDGGEGDARHRKLKSDHNPNSAGVFTARDFTHDPEGGLDCNKLAAALVASRDPRIKYVIWNGRITSDVKAGAWKKYTGTNKHNHHLHLSVNALPKYYDDASEWDLSIFKSQPKKFSQDSAVSSPLLNTEQGEGLATTSPQTPSVTPPIITSSEQPSVNNSEPATAENMPDQSLLDNSTGAVQTVVEKTTTEKLSDGLDKFQTTSEKITSVTGTVGNISKESWFTFGITKLTGLIALIIAFVRDNWLECLVAVVLIGIAVAYFNAAKNRASARSTQPLPEIK